MAQTNCEDCWYYDYDEEYDAYFCRQDFDEDEYYRILTRPDGRCPYFRRGDDYLLARKQ